MPGERWSFQSGNNVIIFNVKSGEMFMNMRKLLSAAVLAVGVSGFAMADVTGKASFEGKAPERKRINMSGVAQCAQLHTTPVLEDSVIVGKDNGLANVVISISNPPAGGKVPAEPAVLNQKGCMYEPHVLPIMVGQKILVKNSDAFLHNVHGLPENNPGFNFGQNNIDANGKAIPPMKIAEYFRVKCDVHPWMNAQFAVFEHPYFAVSGADGSFTLKGLPDGEYDVMAWHEKLGEQEGKVSVKGGKGAVNFTFKPEEQASVAQPVKAVADIKLGACSENECCAKKADAAVKPVAGK
jgi:plastocyanin